MDSIDIRLRRLRAMAEASTYRAGAGAFTLGSDIFGVPVLERGVLHEVFAQEKEDAAAAAGFVAGLVLRLSNGKGPSLWVRHARSRAGTLYGGGLAALGIDPCALIHLPVQDDKDGLRAALEGLRCKGLASVVVEIAGASRHLDLTASRRLKLAAATHGVTALILRHGTDPGPSAAVTRWRVAAALSGSPGLGLPGNPAFTLTLLKHRSAEPGRKWELEWDHDTRAFAPKTISRPVVALPFDRTHREVGKGGRARTG